MSTKRIETVPEDIEGLGDAEDASWGDYPIDTMLIRNENPTVRDVLRRIEQGFFVMNPDFQRDFIWPDDKQSKLIENPEVHLHPARQALMGQFLTDAAQAGVQVIAETHSDHILNGIRRAVRAGKLPPDQVAIHFFRPRSADAAQVISPQLDSAGNIDTWPEGFFDQFDKDTSHFAGWGE